MKPNTQEHDILPSEYAELIEKQRAELESIPDEWLRVVGMGGYNLEAGRREMLRNKLLTNHIEHMKQDIEDRLSVLETLQGISGDGI